MLRKIRNDFQRKYSTLKSEEWKIHADFKQSIYSIKYENKKEKRKIVKSTSCCCWGVSPASPRTGFGREDPTEPKTCIIAVRHSKNTEQIQPSILYLKEKTSRMSISGIFSLRLLLNRILWSSWWATMKTPKSDYLELNIFRGNGCMRPNEVASFPISLCAKQTSSMESREFYFAVKKYICPPRTTLIYPSAAWHETV